MGATSPNIVLVTVDSLRADYCGFHDESEATTPFLDELLSTSGVVYDTAIAPGPSTHESMPAIFSGATPATDGHGLSKREEIGAHLEAHKAIPERIADRGYSSAAFTPNPFTSRRFSYDGGWDHFDDYLDRDSTLDRVRSTVVKRWLRGEFVAGTRFFLNMVGLGDIAIDWRELLPDVLDAASDLPEPFFIWVFLLEPHWPYLPSRANREVSWISQWNQNWRASNASSSTPTNSDAIESLYRGTIRDVDEFVETLTAELAEYDPTYVLHGDHGEALGERGYFGHDPVLYEENIHVPWVVWNGDLSPKRISGPASLRNLPHLLVDVADGDPSFESYAGDVAFSSSDRNHAVAHAGRWKAYSRPDDGVRVYDLDVDPGERSPRAIQDGTGSVTCRPLAHQTELRKIADSVGEFRSME